MEHKPVFPDTFLTQSTLFMKNHWLGKHQEDTLALAKQWFTEAGINEANRPSAKSPVPIS